METVKEEKDWAGLLAKSWYATATEIKNAMDEEDYENAYIGLQKLVEQMGKSEERGIFSFLKNIMLHIIKWFSQTEKRSGSWAKSIENSKNEIINIQEEHPRLNKNFLLSIWEKAFKQATREAEAEMGKKSKVESLTYQDVFEKEYKIEEK